MGAWTDIDAVYKTESHLERYERNRRPVEGVVCISLILPVAIEFERAKTESNFEPKRRRDCAIALCELLRGHSIATTRAVMETARREVASGF